MVAKTSKYDLPVNLNLNVRGLRPSATLAINEYSYRLAKNGKKIYKLGLGQSPFPVPDVVVKELEKNAYHKEYLPVQGLPGLRKAVAKYNQRKKGIHCNAGDIIIGPGSKELIFILQLVYYGDLVIPTPTWVSYSPQARIIGRQVNWAQTRSENNWRMTPEELDLVCRDDPGRPRIVILNYPANPTGATYSKEELKEIAKLARKYNIVLISDEIYGELNYEGDHISIAHYYPEGTIISSGLSKWCGAGGWRLGTFTFPPNLHWLSNAMCIVASETFTSTAAPIQYAAIKAFQDRKEIETYLYHCRRILKLLGQTLTRKLSEMQVFAPDPQAAFYLFPDFEAYREKLKKHGIITSYELCNRLLENTGVAILPGKAFGHSPETLTARIAFVNFDGAKALKTSKKEYHNKDLDQDFLQACCSDVLEAFDRIGSWLNSL